LVHHIIIDYATSTKLTSKWVGGQNIRKIEIGGSKIGFL
jgi:hypothetical protein